MTNILSKSFPMSSISSIRQSKRFLIHFLLVLLIIALLFYRWMSVTVEAYPSQYLLVIWRLPICFRSWWIGAWVRTCGWGLWVPVTGRISWVWYRLLQKNNMSDCRSETWLCIDPPVKYVLCKYEYNGTGLCLSEAQERSVRCTCFGTMSLSLFLSGALNLNRSIQ